MKTTIKIHKFLSVMLLMWVSLTYGQQRIKDQPTYLYLNVDKIPKFKGGDQAFKEFLVKNLKWPEPEIYVSGAVLVSFIILPNGDVSQVRVERSLAVDFDKEAVKVMTLMPKWIPGEINKRKVKVKMYLPIEFIIR